MTRGDKALALLASAIPSLALLQAVTYDAWADGVASDIARGAIVALSISAVSWSAVRLTLPERPGLWRALPWLTAVLVLVPTNLVHFARITHPAARTHMQAIMDDFERFSAHDDRTWIAEMRGEGVIAPRKGAVVLTTEPGGAAFLDLILPERPPANSAGVWLPRGLYREEYDEVLEWEAGLQPLNEFSVVLDTRHLLVQATHFGLHLTYPNLERHLTEHHVEMPELKDGRVRHFRLERSAGLIRLRINDVPAWVYPDAGKLEVIRFGETRPDPLHAGVLTLQRVRYERRFPL